MNFNRRTVVGVALSSLFAAWPLGPAQAQTLGPDFASSYVLDNVLGIPGVPTPYGGLEFKDGDPNKLLIVGLAADPLATIYEVDVTRDALGHITGFSGFATLLASAPSADGGLEYGPGGVLFYTAHPTTTLGQIKPGSTAPDKLVDLSLLGVAPSTGGLAITPNGFPSAGSLKITSYNGDSWYDADLVPDGTGTFDVSNVALRASLAGVGPESIIHVDSTYPVFSNQSVIICEWFVETAGAYEVDASGDPIPGTRRDFLTCCGYWPEGSTIDPLTGDFLFSDHGSGDQILVIQAIDPPVGTNYCISVSNSTGLASTISATGSASLTANDLVLTADNLPSQPGIFIAGPTQTQFPFFNGFLCVDPQGLQRFLNVASPAGGSITEAVDYATAAAGGLNVVAGSTYNYQRWNRDPAAGGGNANFSNGYEIAHTP